MKLEPRVARTTSWLVLICCLFGCAGPGASRPDDAEIPALIEAIREDHGMPALGVLVMVDGEVRLLTAKGVREQGREAAVTEADQWHIGSNTKAMTATLIATFVRDGMVGFDTPVMELFPERAARFGDDATAITIDHLLTHRAGFAPDPFASAEEYVAAVGEVTDVGDQRLAVLEKAVSEALLFPPGTDFSYSNTGYIVAAAVAERLGSDSFESLLAARVLAPLGITSYGFGPPGSAQAIDQPRGHRESSAGLVPVSPDDQEYQNPPLYNSAGGVHISLQDWARFADEHLRGSRGEGRLFGSEIYEHLQMPPGAENGFAMGWGVLVEDGRPTMLTHSGSDGNWYADIRLYPPTRIAFLMATNDGREDGEAKAALNEVRRLLTERYEPFRD